MRYTANNCAPINQVDLPSPAANATIKVERIIARTLINCLDSGSSMVDKIGLCVI